MPESELVERKPRQPTCFQDGLFSSYLLCILIPLAQLTSLSSSFLVLSESSYFVGPLLANVLVLLRRPLHPADIPSTHVADLTTASLSMVDFQVSRPLHPYQALTPFR